MTEFLWVGATIGTAIGFLHMLRTILTRWSQPGLTPLKTVWQAIWIWALWILFGAYVLAFWIMGAVCWGLWSMLTIKRGLP
ncbi:MAG: hypothetical protein AAF530_21230 [Pseudomonadota bacterium]